MECLNRQRPRAECFTWDYPTCFKQTKQLVLKAFGRDLWKSCFIQVFEQYQNNHLSVPQRLLYFQWDFVCRLRKTLKRTKQWALEQCIQPDDPIVLNSFMFVPFQVSLFWFFVQLKEPIPYIDLVKHMVTSMNSMLIHLKDIHFPEKNLMSMHFQQNMNIWFTSFNIKKISFEYSHQ